MTRRVLAALLGFALSGAAVARLPVWRAEVVKAFPHDPAAFTEGLFYAGGRLFESTGMEGQSVIREVRLADGGVVHQVTLPPDLFGEGIVAHGGRLVSVTWRTGQGFLWSFPGLKPLGRFSYPGEGWGMTDDGRHLLLSDGTPDLRLLDPVSLTEVGRLRVTAEGAPVQNLNELEWVKGEILANIWLTDRIARIDPRSGHVTGWIDLSGLPRPRTGNAGDAVANGIAWDKAGNRLFVTGKNWPRLYQIRLVPTGGRSG